MERGLTARLPDTGGLRRGVARGRHGGGVPFLPKRRPTATVDDGGEGGVNVRGAFKFFSWLGFLLLFTAKVLRGLLLLSSSSSFYYPFSSSFSLFFSAFSPFLLSSRFLFYSPMGSWEGGFLGAGWYWPWACRRQGVWLRRGGVDRRWEGVRREHVCVPNRKGVQLGEVFLKGKLEHGALFLAWLSVLEYG